MEDHKGEDGQQTKFCYKCWSKVPADAGFCEVCGAFFQDKDEKYIPDTNPVRSFEDAPIRIKKPSRKWMAVPLAIVIFVAVLMVVNSGVFSPQSEDDGIPYVEISHEWVSDGRILHVTVEITNNTQNPIRGCDVICDARIGSGSYVADFTEPPAQVMSPGSSSKCSMAFSVMSKDAYGQHTLRFLIVS